MTERHAVALRAFTIATIPETRIADGQILPGMDAGQFEDFKGCGLVREATEAEAAPLASPPASQGADNAPLTVESYVDRYLAGEGRGNGPEDILLEQFASNHPTEIEEEFARRLDGPATSEAHDA